MLVGCPWQSHGMQELMCSGSASHRNGGCSDPPQAVAMPQSQGAVHGVAPRSCCLQEGV